jgi:hypothetical protein
MTGNQRRTGLRMPWTSAEGDRGEGAAVTSAEASEPADPPAPTPAETADETVVPVDAAPDAAPPPSAESGGEPPDEFMRGLVEAMRKVADEAKHAGLGDVRARADERIRELEAEAEQRRQDLGRRADVDVAAVGEWARAEAERIKAEAERRVSARRTQLEEQLATDATRAASETKSVRDLVVGYEKELEAYHAQLAEISDPAAFAAAAKRMPRPPALRTSTSGALPVSGDAAVPAGPPATDTPPAATPPIAPPPTNGVGPAASDVHPDEEEVLAARLAELNATIPAEGVPDAPAVADPVTTEVVVTGLGSFGAITSFRQALADVDGVEGVALSLGQSGEFIFRATHRAGFDVRDAITVLEGDAATVQPREDGGYLVRLERAR